MTYNECIVMLLQLVKSTACLVGCHKCADRPLVGRTGAGIFLEECRRDERLQHKPPSNIHTVVNRRDMWKRFRDHDEKRKVIGEQSSLPVKLVNPPLPCGVERRSPRVRLSIIGERVFRIPEPYDSRCKIAALPRSE